MRKGAYAPRCGRDGVREFDDVRLNLADDLHLPCLQILLRGDRAHRRTHRRSSRHTHNDGKRGAERPHRSADVGGGHCSPDDRLLRGMLPFLAEPFRLLVVWLRPASHGDARTGANHALLAIHLPPFRRRIGVAAAEEVAKGLACRGELMQDRHLLE